MKIFTQADLDQFNALSCDVVRIHATPALITIQLLKVVALANFKAIAAASRTCPGAQFNATTKTLTVPLIEKSELVPGKMWLGFPGDPTSEHADVFRARGQTYQFSDEALASLVCLCPSESINKVIAVANRLAGGKAKTFNTTTDAFKARKAAANARKPAAHSKAAIIGGQDPEEMDMPMWDPARGEWYDQEWETRDGGQMRDHRPRADMGSYGHDD